jgi:hypothetical protein
MTRAELSPRVAAGLQLFARYAYPPNERGYCGPADARMLLEYAATGTTDRGLAELARGFSGPWPYLTLLAGAAGLDDPFDARVVEAYWVGNELLERVATGDFGRTLEDRFRGRAGRAAFGFLAEGVPAGALCHHSFHVFGVYPWVGLLAESHRGEPLHILDRCRIRWGRVLEVGGTEVVVESQSLTWDGRRLDLGAPAAETARQALDGFGLPGAALAPGDTVALHWDWVCDRLSARQLRNLQHYTRHQLHLTNERVAHSGPGAALS